MENPAQGYHPLLPAAEAIEEKRPSARDVGVSGVVKSDGELSGTYELRIENFTQLAGKIYSEKFEIGTYLWRLLIFPKGNKSNHLSTYLDAPEAPYTPLPMSPKAAFVLTIVNHVDPAKSYCKEAQHTFTPSESDWGFTSFLPLDDVMDQRNGFLDGNAVVLRVKIQVQKDERYSYDSRKETGHVGLKNQGATCYMNSLLQYLFHLPFFRKAVYHMPTLESDEASQSLPLALQSVFYKLQYSKTRVSTKDLTKSFGWGTYDAFMQHDVQELNRVLCEKLEEKMKGTRVEKVITDLFEGHTYSFIECMNVEYKSTRKESFMDLQLDVKGCKNIYDSIIKYCEVETMDGPNQYKAEGHGLQDARKGVLFESFPPVLQLQLKRFEYDFQRDAMVKINDRYEFGEVLDLDFKDGCYLSPHSDRSVRNLYRLHSVLVHSGGVHGGHYYAFIRPDGKQWLKFDDERVTLEDDKMAMDEQFGGEEDNLPPGPGYNAPTFKYAKCSNAYMLVYVRDSDWPRMMCPATKDDIEEVLRHRFEQEQMEKEMRQKEKQEAHLFCTLKVAMDSDLKQQMVSNGQCFDLVNHDNLAPEHIFRIRKNLKFTDFKAMVAEKTGVPVESQRFWAWKRRPNNTFRPWRPLRPDEEALQILDLRAHRETGAPVNKHAILDLKLFLETPQRFNLDTLSIEPTTGEIPARGKHEIFLFIKHYDPATEVLRFVGRVQMHKNTKVQEAEKQLCGFCGMQLKSEIDIYEEVKIEPSVEVELLHKKSTLDELSLEDGDILIVQQSSKQNAGNFRHPTVGQHMDYVRNRRLVHFKRLEDPQEEGISLELMRDMTYDEVTGALAKLNLGSPTKLRLTQYNAYSHQPQRNPIKYRGINRLEGMLQHANHTNDILYYEVLDLPLPELEQLKILRVSFHNERGEHQSEHTVRLPKESTVADVLSEVQSAMEASTDSTVAAAAKQHKASGRVLRLMEVYNSRLYKVCEASEGIETINEGYWNLRAELVPEDQIPGKLSGGEQIIHVYHMNLEKESYQITNFGDPFLLRISDADSLADVKPRIKSMLGVTDEEFAKWEFFFVSVRSPPVQLSESDVIGPLFTKTPVSTSEHNYLGLQHEDTAPRRVNTHRRTTYERPVKIN